MFRWVFFHLELWASFLVRVVAMEVRHKTLTKISAPSSFTFSVSPLAKDCPECTLNHQRMSYIPGTKKETGIGPKIQTV
jgi:hypothetical protein